MRNKVAKKLRKEAGSQHSTSNQMEYEYLKKEHMKTEVFPKTRISKRESRISSGFKTESTLNVKRGTVGAALKKLKG